MPSRTDSDANRREDKTIIVSCNVECPSCTTTVEVEFDTGARDQDGLADLEPGDLVADVRCPNCDEDFQAEYEGWMNYGDAG